MLRFSTGKIVATIGFIVIGLLLAVPSLFTPQQRQGFVQSIPSWVPGWMVPTRAIVLGLDLQGGSHVLLEVDVADLVRGRTGLVNQLRDDVRRVLRDNRASVEGGIQVTQRGVQLRISDPNERARIAPKLRELSQPISNVILGQTGARNVDIAESPDGLFQLTLTEQGLNDRVRRAVDQAIEVLRRRVDALGTTEPNIQRQGADRILVQVPGLQDPQRLKEILGQTAKLEFRMVAEPGATDVDLLPSKETPGQTQAIERRVIVEGGDLTDAQPGFDNRTGEPVVNFRFNIRGAQRFGQTTSENVGRLLAIVLDNQVISAPRILSPITGGSGQISGRFTVQQANDLSVLLRAGALPAKLTIVEERTVGPGLGKDSIEAGKHATYVATVFVVDLHVRDLRPVRLLRQHRAARPCRPDLRADVGPPGDADAARHRRHRADDRHRGRLERPDLRAHPRGGACRALDRLRHPGRLRPGLRDHHRLELDHGDRRRHPVLPGHRDRCAASPSSSSSAS